MPFGVGTRVCGGQNLAHITLRAAIAAIVSNFEVSANRNETNERTMVIKDAFVSARRFSSLPHAHSRTGHSPRHEGMQTHLYASQVLILPRPPMSLGL